MLLYPIEMMSQKIDAKIVDQLTKRIIAEIHPLRIILFGSYARGDIHSDSDIDLFVIMPNGTHRRQTAQKLYLNITDIDVPFDVIVGTPDDLEKYGSNPSLIYKSIEKEGIEIYAEW